eukprot:CAMPEP_0171367166 /NCGR_PEP_ID=MMETSP0879-20121228/5912_1 /TAXON_ID=67004 /ORGANISM="Thalassiosira weissflogii, Strain CCMP1336" /LENGTH=179 /DNA_ID=CAMNT_0011875161 /DNA_START=40 /DNA_END=579 /DNA_ORIENTATION=-
MTNPCGVPEQKQFTLENVHDFSTYELRQELKQRGKFCGADAKVNHEILLKSMIALLVDERDAKQSAAGSPNALFKSEAANIVSKERAERKKAAIVRSKQRLSSAKYLEEKKRANEEFKKKTASNDVISIEAENRQNSSVKYSLDINSTESRTEGNPGDKRNEDPFAPKFRARLGGRCFQ